MAYILTDLGEEYLVKTDVDSVSVDFGLYDDSVDSISETDDLGAITTEPDDGNYSRVTAAVSASDVSGDWGIDNDNAVRFDVTNTTGTVESYFIVDSFKAADTNDASAKDHLLMTGVLSKSYDLVNFDAFEIAAGSAGFTVD